MQKYDSHYAEFQAYIKEKQKESKLEGKLENEQTIVSNMLKKGLDATYIHEITDIPIERIESLKVQQY